MIYYIKKNRNIIIATAFVLIMISGIIYKNTVYETQVLITDEEEIENVSREEAVEEQAVSDEITVYICGNVKNPSNVTLPKNSRVEDAIKLAGGATETADLTGINLAQKLTDEDMIYVPKKGEVIQAKTTAQSNRAITDKDSRININQATAEELDKLPGVGPSTAQNIIEYRKKSGGFKSIEEINNVTGIGDAKYKDIKAMITVD